MIKTIIYPASRPFTEVEKEKISSTLSNFLPTWMAHGVSLVASFKIAENQFIIISVNENIEPTSGCSIDYFNGIMRELDTQFNLGIFDRMKACYLGNDKVKTLPLYDFRNALKNGTISHNVQVFDFSVANEKEYSERFLLPLNESWAKVYL